MVLRSRREYLEAIRLRYYRSSKKDKAVILDEFCSICGYNRKYAIRLLRKNAGLSSRKRPGPRSIYFAFRFGPGFCGRRTLVSRVSICSTNATSPRGLPERSCLRNVVISSSDDTERKLLQIPTIESNGSTFTSLSS